MGPNDRALQSISGFRRFKIGGANMHATTAAKVTLFILIVILILMIRNVFAIEPRAWAWSAQCSGPVFKLEAEPNHFRNTDSLRAQECERLTPATWMRIKNGVF
jgi:hypothetical protein